MIPKIKEFLKKVYLSKWFIVLIIIIGSAIRLRQYLFNRSLWLDEAMLSLNIIRYNYLDLIKPLDYGQTAPSLFLLITKFFTEIFGYSEYVFRLLPLIAGIASLVLFWYLANKFLHKFLIPIAVGLLAFSRYAIYYSNEFKQYSVDLMVTIIIFILAIYIYEKNFDLKSNLLLGFLGALFMFLSHPSIFILVTVSVSLVLSVFFKEKLKGVKKIGYILSTSLFWIISFVIYYLFVIRIALPGRRAVEFFQLGFAPLITSINDLLWYQNIMLGLIKSPLYFYAPDIAILMILGGIIGFYRKRDKIFFLLMILPLLILLIASFFKFYSIQGRLLLFSLSIFYLLIAKGLEEFYFSISNKKIIATLLLILLLFYQPLNYSFKVLFQPELKEETRPLIEYYQKFKSGEDKIYVYYSTEPAFLHYTRDTNEKFELLLDRSFRGEAYRHLDELKNLVGEGRVWFIFSHIYGDEEKIVLEKLDGLGQRLDYVEKTGARLYLYNF
jgi:hypothetical protein